MDPFGQVYADLVGDAPQADLDRFREAFRKDALQREREVQALARIRQQLADESLMRAAVEDPA